MDNALRFLTDTALGCMREELTCDADYRQCRAEEEALWAQLRRRYQGGDGTRPAGRGGRGKRPGRL